MRIANKNSHSIEDSTDPMARMSVLRATVRWLGFLMLLCIAFSVDAQDAKQGPSAPVLRFRLWLNRITPDRVTVPAGRYRIRVDNGIVLGKAISVVVARDGAPPAVTTRVPKDGVRAEAEAEVTLAPGAYFVTAGGRAEWRAVVTVTTPGQ
jgi:hypothetical protein